MFQDVDVVERCFWLFILPILEYCSPVWSSTDDCHLALLDRVVSSASFLCHGAIRCDLGHRRYVASLCMFYKIRANCDHPVNQWMPSLLFRVVSLSRGDDVDLVRFKSRVNSFLLLNLLYFHSLFILPPYFIQAWVD